MRSWAAVLVLSVATGCAPDFSRIPGLSGLTPPTDEELIARVMEDVHRGMESRRIYRVLSHVSRDYYDAQGRDYAAMEDYLSELMRRYRHIEIERVRPRVVVEGERARVVETFGTRADPMPGVSEVPVNLQGQVMVYLQKENGNWKIVEWGHLG